MKRWERFKSWWRAVKALGEPTLTTSGYAQMSHGKPIPEITWEMIKAHDNARGIELDMPKKRTTKAKRKK